MFSAACPCSSTTGKCHPLIRKGGSLDLNKKKLNILCPVYNEEKVIPLFFERIHPVIQKLSPVYETFLIFINNSSSDGSYQVVKELYEHHSFIRLISLSKNVGYQRSLECGLRSTLGDMFVFIDVDCEDPPEMIVQFVEAYQAGYEIVYGERIDREEPGWIQYLRKVFYRFTRAVADEEIILDMAEFSLLSAEVRDAILQDVTSFPFIRASIGRVGFRRLGIPYKRARRIAGTTHYNFLGMTKFAVAGVLSSTTLFLRLPIYIFPLWLTAIVCLGAACSNHNIAWAMPALLVVAFSYFGFVLSFASIYIARIYKNTLGRPNAFIDERFSLRGPANAHSSVVKLSVGS